MKIYLFAFCSFLASTSTASELNLRGLSNDVANNRLPEDIPKISDGLDNYGIDSGDDGDSIDESTIPDSGKGGVSNGNIDVFDPTLASLDWTDDGDNIVIAGTRNLAPGDKQQVDGDADIAEDDSSPDDLIALDSESVLFDELLLNPNDDEDNEKNYAHKGIIFLRRLQHQEQTTISDARDLQDSSMSQNLYAIPYEPGTSVRVNRDHITHTPPNRIDMSGKNGGPYNIVAALDGTIKFIEDSHNINGGCENNNYVWIAHANGEWTKYSHLAHQSASVNAGLSVGDSVSVGQFLGVEDDIGCASGDHLHWEVAVPNDVSNPINPIGGYIKGVNLIPRICGIPNNIYSAGTTYTVPGVRPGWGEYARHGLAQSKFQADFDAVARCGYRMDWNSGYDTGGGSAAYNVVYHANTSPALSWKSHRRLTQSELTSKKSEYGSQGYKLVHIDVYNLGNSIRYAAIFHKGTGVPNSVATYHGVTAAQHQATLDLWKKYNYKPHVLSVASVSGNRYYAGVYTTDFIGSWFAKSQQTSSQYQTNFDDNKDKGRRLIYLKSYVHNNARYYSAIWASQAVTYVYAKHGLTDRGYKNYFDWLLGYGYETRCVSATQVNGYTTWAAFWDKE